MREMNVFVQSSMDQKQMLVVQILGVTCQIRFEIGLLPIAIVQCAQITFSIGCDCYVRIIKLVLFLR